MAKQEADREDLIRDAVSLVDRAELKTPGFPDLIIAGRRATGAWSFYFGSEPVFQFDTEGGLRRAFVNGKLYRTQGTTCAELTRHREPGKSEFDRHDLTPDELTAFLAHSESVLSKLRDQFWNEEVEIVRSVGLETGVKQGVINALHLILKDGLHLSPAIPTRP